MLTPLLNQNRKSINLKHTVFIIEDDYYNGTVVPMSIVMYLVFSILSEKIVVSNKYYCLNYYVFYYHFFPLNVSWL